MLTKIRDRLLVCKQRAQNLNVERFNLRKLSGLELVIKYQIKISVRYAALENLYDSEETNRAWENMKEDIKISAKETIDLYDGKQHKPWFDEECSQAKMQWLQDPDESKEDNRNYVRREASRYFRKKRKKI